ncbi:TonB-dependent receptor [Mesoterricola sediminis]|uniref:Membrane protein n=1 Tax=Mesoterricola sediminis TaxID=2927980 RepID=A0AA48KDT7_9BACT|nr:carboxypeptidase regulatory-like domain-containing protein [Mesoterricola sediminis]BDU78546.1 membrane protein [Mesoterricola sediminis]
MTSRFSTLASIGALLVAGVSVHAQSLQTGEVTGTVRDKSGRPVPGAKITAKSGQVSRTAVTSAAGEYRLPLLNAGRWNLTALHDGFQVASASLQVSINETRIANFSLVSVQAVVVEVVDKLGELDTTSTQVGVNLSGETLATIPMDMTSMNALDGLMASVPGVRVADTGVFQVMGGSNDQNAYVVDGNLTNKTYSNTSTSNGVGASVQPAREFIETVEVVTNAFGAEYGVFGGVVNALTKSGSNTFTGSLFYGTNFPKSAALPYYAEGWTPQRARTAEDDKYHRYGFTVGGPIIKDKLFFFVGFQGFRDVVPPTTLATGSLNWNGLKSDDTKISGPNQWTAKLNWYIDASNQLILSATRSHYRSNTGHQYSDYGTLDSGAIRESTNQNVNLTWNWLPTSDFYLVASVGNFKNPSSTSPITGVDYPVMYYDGRYFVDGPGSALANKPAQPEYASYTTGTGGLFNSRGDNPNTQYRVDASWTLGRHNLKAGYLRQVTTYEDFTGGEDIYSIGNSITSPYSWYFLYRLRWSSSYTKYNGVLQGHYLKDVVTLAPGLRLDAGLRYDSFNYKGAFGPYDGMHLADYDKPGRQLQPRIGLVWDVDQDGRKKIFAHFGRYFMSMPMSAVSWAKTSGIYYDMWFPGSWTYNQDYSGGPITLGSQTPDMTMLLLGGTGKPQPHATDLRLPRKNAWTVGADWTLAKGLSVGGSWTFWELKDVMDDSYFLNEDGSAAFSALSATKVIWNPHPGAVTFVDSDGVQHTWNSNFPEPKNRYIGLNLHASMQGERYGVTFNYTWTHHYGNYQGESQNYLTYATTGNQTGAGSAGLTYDFDFAKGIADGNMEGDPVHEFKLQGSCRFAVLGHDFTMGLTSIYQSGVGLTSTMNAGARWAASATSGFGGLPTSYVTVNNLRGDMGNAPWNLLVNTDLSTSIRFKGIEVRLNASIHNVFNSRTVLGRWGGKYEGSYQSEITADPNYGLVIRGMAGRSVTAGCSIQF